MDKVYDCLIIGGGPAGLSAAIYMARYNRSVIVIDAGNGRWNSHEINENFFGFPLGIKARKLRELGLKQAKKFGALVVDDKALRAVCSNNILKIEGEKGTLLGKTLIIATGVSDVFPKSVNREEYLGKSLFWCIMCDGYKANGKKVAVVGNNDEAASTCMQFLNFTKKLVFITDSVRNKTKINPLWHNRIKKAKIPIFEEKIKKIIGEDGFIKRIKLENGVEVGVDFMFSQEGAKPNSKIAKELGVATDENGYIIINEQQRTNVSKVYAAGDVTKKYPHQIVTAAFEGAAAAESANYDLYLPEQRFG